MLSKLCFLIVIFNIGTARADFTQVVEASCLVRLPTKVGSGVIYSEDESKYWILTAGHIVKDLKLTEKVKCVFYKDGKIAASTIATVVNYVYQDDDDLGLLFVNKVDVGYKIRPIPLTRDIYNDSLLSFGFPAGGWGSGWIGRKTSETDNIIKFWPKPERGRSGSGLFNITGDYLLGIVLRDNGTAITHTRIRVLLEKWKK